MLAAARVFLAASWLLAAPPQVSQVGPPVAPQLREQLQLGEQAIACVCLKDPLPDAREPLLLRVEAYREAREDFLRGLPAGQLRVRREYRYSPVLLLEVDTPEALSHVEASPWVAAVGLDGQGSGGLLESRKLIRADQVFDQGITGQDRVVAVIDSGVASSHPDLAPALIHQHHILSQGADEGEGAEDGHGHGTNVAGIAVSRGTVAPRGLAPGAKLIAVKVLDNQNRGFLSDWAAGVEYVVGLHEAGTVAVDAINMSLVSDLSFTGDCDASYTAFSGAVNAARELGVAVFASSGNTGSWTKLTSPACLNSVISVGSVPDSLPDRISTFTSRNAHLKLLAPGDAITSTGLDGGTSTFVGTSQASPHAAGSALLLRSVHPGVPVDLILGVLQATGVEVSDSGSGLTYPRIDLLAAVELLRDGPDCNGNGYPDAVDIRVAGTSFDLNGDGIPDECVVSPVPFRRADANASGVVDLSDSVKTFLYLFAGTTIPCRDAADSNDSGQVDLSDGIYTLNRLFQGGPDFPAPGPDVCGLDPTIDDVDCTSYAPCAE